MQRKRKFELVTSKKRVYHTGKDLSKLINDLLANNKIKVERINYDEAKLIWLEIDDDYVGYLINNKLKSHRYTTQYVHETKDNGRHLFVLPETVVAAVFPAISIPVDVSIKSRDQIDSVFFNQIPKLKFIATKLKNTPAKTKNNLFNYFSPVNLTHSYRPFDKMKIGYKDEDIIINRVKINDIELIQVAILHSELAVLFTKRIFHAKLGKLKLHKCETCDGIIKNLYILPEKILHTLAPNFVVPKTSALNITEKDIATIFAPYSADAVTKLRNIINELKCTNTPLNSTADKNESLDTIDKLSLKFICN